MAPPALTWLVLERAKKDRRPLNFALTYPTHPLPKTGPTRVIPFDLGEKLEVDYPATSPNLLAAYIRILPGESLETQARATSQAFYVIRGSGVTTSPEHGEIRWSQGDLFVFPASQQGVQHAATGVEGGEAAALYWVSDEPLLKYLGVTATEKKFEPTLYTRERMVASVELLKHEEGVEHRNRLGILLGNTTTKKNTLTLTHTLWSLLNLLPAGQKQRPHRHNSVALDLCVSSAPTGTYTLMGPELDEDGWVKDPVKMDWASGACFVTPPGWWHSHHNDSEEDAWVLPLQDAGLYTAMRTLDIQFSVADKNSEASESTVALRRATRSPPHP